MSNKLNAKERHQAALRAETNPFYRALEEIQPELVQLVRNMHRQAEQLASRYEMQVGDIPSPTAIDVLAIAIDYAVKQETQGQALPREQAAARMAYTLAKAQRRLIANTHSRHSPNLRAGVARTAGLPSHRSIYGVAMQVVRWWVNPADSRPVERVVSPDQLPMAKTFAAELDSLKSKAAPKH